LDLDDTELKQKMQRPEKNSKINLTPIPDFRDLRQTALYVEQMSDWHGHSQSLLHVVDPLFLYEKRIDVFLK
jgi:hypothetical protein